MVETEAEHDAQSNSAPSSPVMDGDDQTDSGDLADDLMDISRSDVDEGEITDYSPEALGVAEKPIPLPEIEDTYEPPLTVNPMILRTPDFPPNRATAHASVSDPSQVTPVADQENSEFQSPKSSMYSSEDTDEIDTGPDATRTQALADDSDPDDYEPPEPSTPTETLVLPVSRDFVSSEPANPIQDTDSSLNTQSLPSGVELEIHNRANGIIPERVNIVHPKVCTCHDLQR